ncbi:MAG: pyrroline-5-carboxylate reductase [Anaerolineae bacterium]
MVSKLAVIGGGVMAEAILRAILDKSLIEPSAVTVGEPLEARRQELHDKLGVTAVADNVEVIDGAEAVLLAVKPQVAARAMAEIARVINPEALVLSIVAGLAIDTICQALPVKAVVRVMPNTPAQIGEGMSVWLATPKVTLEQRSWAKSVMAALGDEVQVYEEKYLDMATAISGSGPAYVFLFVEAITDAAVQLGFSRDIATRLAWQTVRGSAVFGQQSGVHPAILRNQVTSPGGTTAEALDQLEQAGFRAGLNKAIQACYAKAQQLGKGAKA